jgi:hypothetical protein
VWDLAFDKTTEVRLRTKPLYGSQVQVGLEGIPAPGVGRFALLAPPGTYTIKLEAGGRQLSQPVTLLKDPSSGGGEQDLEEQTNLALDLRDDVNRVATMIDTAERVRGQVVAIRAFLPQSAEHEGVRQAAEGLDAKVVAFEEQLFQMRVTGRGQDLLRWPAKLAEQLLYLANQLNGGDFAPTAAQREVHQLLHADVARLESELQQVVTGDVTAFNAKLEEKKVRGVITGR